MPNQQGGKNYKKMKHSSGDLDLKLQEAEADQMYGRVTKILGNLNMNVFCNDNVTRICKVCGAMRKRVWINVGDLVIISFRDFETKKDDEDENKKKKALPADLRGDILYRFDPSLLGKAKKIPGINPRLFLQVENTDGKILSDIGKTVNNDDDEGGIEFDRGSEDDDEDGSSNEDGKVVSKADKKLKKAKESKFAKVENNNDDEDINVDDI